MKQVNVSNTTFFIVFIKTRINPMTVGVIFKSEIKTRKMKILLILLTLIPSYIMGQKEIIESIKLDSLIFEKINNYRLRKGVNPFVAFEDSLMRDFSYELTRLNSTKETIEHSKDNNYEYYNVECIYSHKKYGTINSTEWYVNQIETGNYTEMAEEVLEGWINSPSHENGISNPCYHIATVTSRITLNKETKVGFLVVSYHALSKNRGNYSKYTYNSKTNVLSSREN